MQESRSGRKQGGERGDQFSGRYKLIKTWFNGVRSGPIKDLFRKYC